MTVDDNADGYVVSDHIAALLEPISTISGVRPYE